jgi:hypothetical protein
MDVLRWLLDADAAIVWQALRDLTDASDDEVSAARARVATTGWGAALLALQGPDGQWDGGTYFPVPYDSSEPGQPWTATTFSLLQLREFGLDPASAAAEAAVARVRAKSRWEEGGQAYFDGEVEPCINGMAVAIGAYFGATVDGIVGRLLEEQLGDGGWNCEAERGSTRSSFHTTISVVEGLLEYARATGGSDQLTAARLRAEDYLLDRGLCRRKSTGAVVDPDWLRFSHPTRWHYDVLRGLEYFRAAGAPPDHRAAEALDLVRSKRRPDGTWLLENSHPGRIHFRLDPGDGLPSRWNTLRALRVLHWADNA